MRCQTVFYENKLVVGVADMKVSNDPHITLATYSLGSCIAVSIYDPLSSVGGILHYMLPDSSIDNGRGRQRPFMFADTGIPTLFREAYKLGAQKSRLIVKLAGGANIMDNNSVFGIGRKNYLAVKEIFKRNGINTSSEDVGGNKSRTVFLKIDTGEVFLKFAGSKVASLL